MLQRNDEICVGVNAGKVGKLDNQQPRPEQGKVHRLAEWRRHKCAEMGDFAIDILCSICYNSIEDIVGSCMKVQAVKRLRRNEPQ